MGRSRRPPERRPLTRPLGNTGVILEVISTREYLVSVGGRLSQPEPALYSGTMALTEGTRVVLTWREESRQWQIEAVAAIQAEGMETPQEAVAITDLTIGTWVTIYGNGSGVVTELALGASGDVLTSNGPAAAPSWQTPAAGGSAHVIQEDGTPLTDRANLNFVEGLIASDAGAGPDATDVDINWAGVGDIADIAAAESAGVALTVPRGDHVHAHPSGLGADLHHTEAHTVASHSDTTATGAELETLTDGSNADALHTHALSALSGTLDHGADLTGLADDDHTQYALLAGRAGGQTLIGGTAASENLTLQSTANATRGDVIVLDGSLLVGVNDTTPGLLSIFGGATTEAGGELRLYNNVDDDGLVDFWRLVAEDGTGRFALYDDVGTQILYVDDSTLNVNIVRTLDVGVVGASSVIGLRVSPTISTTVGSWGLRVEPDLTVTAGTFAQYLMEIGATAGASVTINSATAIPIVASIFASEPNITETSGSVTEAATLWIASAPTEAPAGSNFALNIESGALGLAGSPGTTGQALLSQGNDATPVWGNPTAAPANPLNVGTDDDDPGIVNIFGGAAAEDGGLLRIYHAADEDTNVDFWAIRADPGDELVFASSGEGSLFSIDRSGTLLSFLRVGQNDAIAGEIALYGDSAGVGGSIDIYNGATGDTNTDLWRISTGETAGDFRIAGDANVVLEIDDTTFTVRLEQGLLDVGDNDVTRGLISAYGGTTGVAGALRLYNPADQDTPVDYWEWVANVDAAGGLTLRTASGTEIVRVLDSLPGFNIDVHAAIGGGFGPLSNYTLTVGSAFSTAGIGVGMRVASDITATGGTGNLYHTEIGSSAGASVVINSAGAHPIVASLFLSEPNITETSGSVTEAATLWIASAPTEAPAGSNFGLNLESGALGLAGSPGTSGQVLVSQGNDATPIWATVGGGSLGNPLQIGIDDDTPGLVQIFGGGATEAGGELRVYQAADDDTNADYWSFLPTGTATNPYLSISTSEAEVMRLRRLTTNTYQVLLDNDGSVASPSIAAWDDPNTGIAWSAAADQLFLVAGGVTMIQLLEGTNDQVLIGPTGVEAAPAIARTTDADTGLWWEAADTLSLVAGARALLRLVEGATDYVELDAGVELRAGATPGAGTSGQVLTSQGSAASPEWADAGGGGVPSKQAISTLEIPVANGLYGATNVGASTTWRVANEAFYFPIILTEEVTIKRLLWRTGTTGGNGNYDIGLYTSNGEGEPDSRLTNLGSTAFPAANTEVASNIADQTIGPGLFYIGLSLSSTSDSTRVAGTLNVQDELIRRAGIWREASALPLPATATPVATGFTSVVYHTMISAVRDA